MRYSRIGHHDRGMLLVWFSILLAALMAFVSLGVDLGRVQLAKTELQRAADAAARYAASGLSQDSTVVISRAVTAAGDNTVDSLPLVLLNSDVEMGNWDSETASFTVGGLPANAVRVTGRRTSARGNPIPLLFARAIGLQTCDVTAVSIATASGSNSGTGIIGLTELKGGNNTVIAGYNPDLGAPGGANLYGTAGALSNQKIDYGNNTSIQGVAGVPSGANITFGNNSTVSGGQTTLQSPLSFANTEAPSVGSSGAINLGNNQTLTLLAGTYSYTQINTGNNCTVQFTGPAVLYITDKIAMGNNGRIYSYANEPENLQIRVTGGGVLDFGNSPEIYGHVYMPQGEFKAGNSLRLRGWIVANKISSNNNAHYYYDQTPVIDTLDTGGSTAATIALVQ